MKLREEGEESRIGAELRCLEGISKAHVFLAPAKFEEGSEEKLLELARKINEEEPWEET